jgi:sporulation protein YlmC with PRC-barrel domain
MLVVRDLLDKQVLDRRNRKIGKVDGLVMQLRKDAPPRLAILEIGAVTLARRLHSRLAEWVEVIERRWGPGDGRPVRIPYSKVTDVGLDVEVDVDGDEIGAFRWENWLKTHVLSYLPWSGV